MARIYLDHAAATPILPAARDAMAAAWDRWANPSSAHREGRAARAALEGARAAIKAQLGWTGELLFTGGASEAATLALAGPGPRAVAAVEHEAVRRAAGGAATLLPVDGDGQVALDRLPPGALVAVQLVNGETGVIQPADRVAAAVAAAGGRWVADAAQAAGRIALPAADRLILSAHKLGGPPGVGALLVRELGGLAATGGQERGYRAGTENLPAILGFAAALAARPSRDHLPALRAQLEDGIRAAGGEVVAAAAPRVAEIGSYRLPGLASAAQLIEFDLAGIAVSAGSACASGSLKPSATLAAMGWTPAAAREVVRVSFAPTTTAAEVDGFLQVYRRLAARARAA